MTEVYDAASGQVVANGDAYKKVKLHYEVPNCLPLDGPKLGERYQLRADNLPVISVKCIAQGEAGIQTAKFVEI